MDSRHTIPGSERQALEGAQAIGPARPDERIEVTLRLRAKTPVANALTAIGAADDTHPGQRKYLTREQFAAAHGADAQDVASIAAFAKAHKAGDHATARRHALNYANLSSKTQGEAAAQPKASEPGVAVPSSGGGVMTPKGMTPAVVKP